MVIEIWVLTILFFFPNLGINEFKKSLGDFLRDKANGDGVLTADDVTTFFAGLQEKRKEQQRTTFMPPDNCKF